MNTNDIRLATIGTSVITSALVAAVGRTPGIRIDAVHSRDAGKASAKAAEFGATWSTDSMDELLASPDVDAVYIASPNAVHAEQAIRAIDAGKHVLVEKPAVLDADEWVALVARADAAGVVLLEGMRTEYDPGTAFVRSLLPELGRLRAASFRYQGRSSRYDRVLAGERVNMFDPAFGGGALNDLGVYCVRAMLTLFGMPQRIAAASVPLDAGVDGAGSILAQYPGLVVDLAFSKISTSDLPSEIQGEEATLVIDHISSPRALTLVRRDGTREERTVDGPQHVLDGEVARFVELIASGDDATADHRLTEQTLRVLADARAATA